MGETSGRYDVTIPTSSATKDPGSLREYTLYHISVLSEQTRHRWTVRHRFRDFRQLYLQVCAACVAAGAPS